MFCTYIFYRQLDVRTAIAAWASSADPTVRRRHLECDDVPTSTEFIPPLSGLVNTQYSRVHARPSKPQQAKADSSCRGIWSRWVISRSRLTACRHKLARATVPRRIDGRSPTGWEMHRLPRPSQPMLVTRRKICLQNPCRSGKRRKKSGGASDERRNEEQIKWEASRDSWMLNSPNTNHNN